MHAWARRSKGPQFFVRVRCLLLSMQGYGPTSIAEALVCQRSLVYSVLDRYERDGALGLVDQRVHNGKRKVTGSFKATVARLLRSSPRAFGHARPTWTRELLCCIRHSRKRHRVGL